MQYNTIFLSIHCLATSVVHDILKGINKLFDNCAFGPMYISSYKVTTYYSIHTFSHTEMTEDNSRSNIFFVALEIYRRRNIGTIIRCAVAFGAKAILVVGSPVFSTHGSHGAHKHIEILHFYYWNELRAYVRSLDCCIYGVTSDVNHLNSTSIENISFHSSAVFIIGGKQDALSEEQVSICDVLISVPFPCPPSLSARVNYDVRISLCLHRYVISMQYQETQIIGEKFCMLDLNPRRQPSYTTVVVRGNIGDETSMITQENDNFGTDLLFQS